MTPTKNTIEESVARAICPHLRSGEACLQCPAEVLTNYGPGTQMCRIHAEEAARAAIEVHLSALSAPTEAMIDAGLEDAHCRGIDVCDGIGCDVPDCTCKLQIIGIWRAMLAKEKP